MLSREVTNTNFIVLFDPIESKSMTYHMICFQHQLENYFSYIVE